MESAREHLSQIEILGIKLEQKRLEMAEIQASIRSLPGIRYDRDRVSTSSNGDALPNAVIRLMDKEKEVQDMTILLAETRNKIIGEIQSMSEARYMQFLFARYVELKPLATIADDLYYTYQYARQLHGEALDAFEKEIICRNLQKPT